MPLRRPLWNPFKRLWELLSIWWTIFAFGDSLTDNGNNNHLNSLAKANYVPYGVDFYEGPSGRFCNGRTIIDYLGDLLELSYVPAFANPSATGRNILRGVNYASAAAGILDETGQHLGERFSLRQQVQNFESSLSELRNQMREEKELSQYLAKSLVVMILGGNDYLNNYLLPSLYPTSYVYNPKDYANLLIDHYTRQIIYLYNLGLKKFFLGGVGPLGCIPNQLATGLASPGKCVSFVNDMVGMFNMRLKSVVDQLNTKYPDGIFIYGNTFGAFSDILDNATAYGFNESERGCCGIGRNKGQITCLPFSVPCLNRKQYVFWDAFHPTQAVNQILAQRAYTGPPSDSYPINVKQMAHI
ncbi:GDSL esterase/lipase At1g71250-like isoform X2 [Cornus florida]|uniref:GDSL esterase/lipase At1g71250-like isoform X2 n=1 Tax=Cornus florida TaxID=4283 RepID=UPI00289A7288|nr:GDSL esterase/lipase At1g71250-like isoform X2 [Cornus florida]